jgi:hypothetical protein
MLFTPYALLPLRLKLPEGILTCIASLFRVPSVGHVLRYFSQRCRQHDNVRALQQKHVSALTRWQSVRPGTGAQFAGVFRFVHIAHAIVRSSQ